MFRPICCVKGILRKTFLELPCSTQNQCACKHNVLTEAFDRMWYLLIELDIWNQIKLTWIDFFPPTWHVGHKNWNAETCSEVPFSLLRKCVFWTNLAQTWHGWAPLPHAGLLKPDCKDRETWWHLTFGEGNLRNGSEFLTKKQNRTHDWK